LGDRCTAREFNTNIKGKPFDEHTIDKVWEKGNILHDSLKDIARIDRYGTHISKLSYGKQEKYGWEIDHIKPVSKGGMDDIDNLQPLQWENHRRKENNTHEIF
jgi:hypothetical protein